MASFPGKLWARNSRKLQSGLGCSGSSGSPSLPPPLPWGEKDSTDLLASVTCVPEYQHSVPSLSSGGSPSKRPRVLSPSPPSTPTSFSVPPKSVLAQDTVAAFLALSDDPKIESMCAHGDMNRMDAEVALVLVDKLSSWLSLPEASSYLDSHPNVACKICQHLATLPSSPPDTLHPDPSTSRTAPAAQQGGEPSPASPAPIPPADQARGRHSHGQATPFGCKAK